jgi:hypothetical protein
MSMRIGIIWNQTVVNETYLRHCEERSNPGRVTDWIPLRYLWLKAPRGFAMTIGIMSSVRGTTKQSGK